MPQWDSDKTVLPPTNLSAESLSSSPLPHDVIVRNPPPIIKCAHSVSSRDNSPSPVPSSSRGVFSSRQEYTREQIEHYAATILAISKTSGFLTYRSHSQVTVLLNSLHFSGIITMRDSADGLERRVPHVVPHVQA